jgi:hypothetical protein
MPLQATSGAASYDAFGGGVPFEPTYIEQIFQTWLYTGNGSTQTITNGIDLAGEGGLVWLKQRSGSAASHHFFDTNRGTGKIIFSNLTSQQLTDAATLTSFNSNGFSLGSQFQVNTSNETFASWTFRKQPKFFDCVTYTGDGNATRDIAHNLGSVPGFIIVKATSTTGNWAVWHRSTELNQGYLNTTAAFSGLNNFRTQDSSTTFKLFGPLFGSTVNDSGVTYVAYLFAHDAGGFGLTGTDNVISCGSFTTDGSGNATVNLGYEPQWVMIKRTDSTSQWFIQDNMRGFTANATGSVVNLYANLTNAEAAANGIGLTSTGFVAQGQVGSGATWVYIAIRRGPMKVPTTGTSVFAPVFYANTTPQYSSNFPVDMALRRYDKSSNSTDFGMVPTSRLTGATYFPGTSITDTELSFGLIKYDLMNGYNINGLNSTVSFSYMFRRAPSFMDVCCYSGNSVVGRTVAHNLTVVPELVIIKNRTSAFSWYVRSSALFSNELQINSDSALAGSTTALGSYTSTSFRIETAFAGYNSSGNTYIAYLFASAPGVSKVGSFTGTGATQVINCGFTSGARFVLIKSTSTTGNWYVWDSARGIVAGNDPYLLLNSTAAEVTNTDWVDTAASGFELSNAGGNLANSNGVSYVFLAIS